MLKFNCKSCGQKISVPEVYAGKKGKCPKCKTIVVVPEINDDISLKPQDSDTDNLQYVQQSPEPELRLKRDTSTQTRFEGLSADGLNVTKESLVKPEIKEKPPERKLPWIWDIFLYPTSMSGLINLGIFWILPILLGFIDGLMLPICYIWLMMRLAYLVIAGYMFYYFMECIRDSASGGIRAPENMGSVPDMHEAFEALKIIFVSMVIFWGPLFAYIIYIFFPLISGGERQHFVADSILDVATIFWLLVGYGIFFFPIGLLAIIMFDSSSAYNPFLWITSIFSTFFHYCCLVLFFCFLGFLLFLIMSYFQRIQPLAYLFGAVFIYLAMVSAHLLGRVFFIKKNNKYT